MFRVKLVRNLRTVIWLILVALVPVSAIGLYWANKIGLPDEWRKAIEYEISKHGAHVEIGSLTYIPLKGFVATSVRVYAEKKRIHEISRLEQVGIVLDYASIAGGDFRLRKVEFRNAQLTLPVDPNEPSGDSLRFTQINGTIFMPNERLIEIRNAEGRVGGVDVNLSARLLGKNPGIRGPERDKNEGRRREMVANILHEMEHWNFDPERPPSVQIEIEGELSDNNSIKAVFRIDAPSVEKQQYKLIDLTAEGTLSKHLLTLSSFTARDTRGNISGSADYQLVTRDGRFDMKSSIEIPRLLKSWLDAPVKLDLLSAGNQELKFAGDFNLTNLSAPVVNLTGHALCESIMFRGVSFDSLETWFSWQNGNLFLKDLTLKRPDGEAQGKILKEGNIVRIQLHSTLPIPLYKPFFKGLPLERIIADFTENKDSACEIQIEGSLDIQNRYAWAYNGLGSLSNISYRGVPIKSANCSFVVNHHELDFYNGGVTFDYTDYPLRKTYDGPMTGSATIGRIRYEAASKTVGVESVKGTIWASPMIRLFAPNIADDVERYRFHRPTVLRGSGIVDVTPQGRTDLAIDFKTKSMADYEFLGKDITLSAPQANVRITGDKVHISDLSTEAFGGKVAGKIVNQATSGLSGEISWSKLEMRSLASTYGFELKGGGELTGRIEFSLNDEDVATMNGKGLIALEKAELFSVPVFGPLSSVVSKVVDNKRVGFERAKSAFCTFTIKKGILTTQNFQTSTTSVKFAGDGAVDLSEQTIDFTIRLNARGLLGLITLPLRPFYGLFQFRGTGPLKDPVWENVHFTSPPENQNELLLSEPPKALIVPE